MITRQMKADLKARGYSDAQIRTMTPQQAHAHLAGEAHGGGGEADHRKPNDVERPLESCAHCGGELERGDMLPLNSGGHVHHRCADDYIRARDTARPRVDPELQALCKRALQAKGARALSALYSRLGVYHFDDLEPQQEQVLRAELEALLA
jgi:hypothetical protein